MAEVPDIKKTVWVNSTGKQYSIDRHRGAEGRVDYLMITEHSRKDGRRYRISVPLPMAEAVASALLEAAR